MNALVLFGVLFLLIACGVSLGTALGIAGVVALALFGLGVELTGVNFIAGIASFPLLAIPFFVLAGVILNRAGLAALIAESFERLVGRRHAGLALVAVATCIFWGALSGSGPATTAAVGLILIAPMVRQGYARDFAAAVVANSSALSIVIPPSIAFIIYGNLTGVSVGALFLGGILPGMAIGLMFMAIAYVVGRRRGYRGRVDADWRQALLKTLPRAFWALLIPVIILGGIYGGVFTPTEAAVVSVVYSLFIAGVIYRTLKCRDIPSLLVEAAVTTSVVMFIVTFAGIFSTAASTMGLVDRISRWLVHVSPNGVVFILLADVLVLVLGMFFDAVSITYIMMPILLPVLAHYQIDPVWYGVVFVTALAIGQATPPVGVNLFAAANLAGTEVDAVARESLWFIAGAVVVLIVISLWPEFVLLIPQWAGAL